MTTIAWILIIVSILLILFVVLKKFPALALLDVDSLPGEKEARFKNQIIKQKVERDLSRISGFFGRFYLSLSRYISRFFENTQAQLKRRRINYKSVENISQEDREKMINSLFISSDELLKKEDFLGAEEKLLEAISLDQKNCLAFFKLATVYEDQKKWPEARQTYEHSLKIAKQAMKNNEGLKEVNISEIYFSLSFVEKEDGYLEAALENIHEALEHEPNNPRYLDLILDLSIMRKDKELALVFLEKLALVNPENNKLSEWQEKILNL